MLLKLCRAVVLLALERLVLGVPRRHSLFVELVEVLGHLEGSEENLQDGESYLLGIWPMQSGGQWSSSASHRITAHCLLISSFCIPLHCIVLYCIVILCSALQCFDMVRVLLRGEVEGPFRTKISLEKAPSSVLLDTKFHASSSRLAERLTPCFWMIAARPLRVMRRLGDSLPAERMALHTESHFAPRAASIRDLTCWSGVAIPLFLPLDPAPSRGYPSS
jgi:hypothetical protein